MNRLLFLAALFAALLPAAALCSEEIRSHTERFDTLIESLNAGSAQRSKVVEQLYNELRGPYGRELQQILRETLSRSNILIAQGALEALARYGDPADIGAMETLLATTDKLEVKCLGIRLLPAWCLVGSERARINYVNYASGFTDPLSPSLLEPLRQPPLTRRGRLDLTRDRLQNRVLRTLAGQFDPISSALPHVEDLLFGQMARDTIQHYIGNALGNDPSRWNTIWLDQGRDVEYMVPDEIEEIQLAVLTSLSDMGAEGSPELLQALDNLLHVNADSILQAAYDTMAVMCRTGFGMYEPLQKMFFTAEDSVEAENWRRLRFASANRLAVFVSAKAVRDMSRFEDEAVFAAITDCISSALSYPPEFPDPDGALAAALADGQAELMRIVMMPDLSRGKRSAAALALGRIGTIEAVTALAGILDSVYVSPEFGSDGLRMAESAVESMRLAAIGTGSGRDAARRAFLLLLTDKRQYAPQRPGTPPLALAHLVLWRLQRLARSTDTSFDPEIWRARLGW